MLVDTYMRWIISGSILAQAAFNRSTDAWPNDMVVRGCLIDKSTLKTCVKSDKYPAIADLAASFLR